MTENIQIITTDGPDALFRTVTERQIQTVAPVIHRWLDISSATGNDRIRHQATEVQEAFARGDIFLTADPSLSYPAQAQLVRFTLPDFSIEIQGNLFTMEFTAVRLAVRPDVSLKQLLPLSRVLEGLFDYHMNTSIMIGMTPDGNGGLRVDHEGQLNLGRITADHHLVSDFPLLGRLPPNDKS
jgi:hypothetical protein